MCSNGMESQLDWWWLSGAISHLWTNILFVCLAANSFPTGGFPRGGRGGGGPGGYRGGQRGGRGGNNNGNAMQNGFNSRPQNGNSRPGNRGELWCWGTWMWLVLLTGVRCFVIVTWTCWWGVTGGEVWLGAFVGILAVRKVVMLHFMPVMQLCWPPLCSALMIMWTVSKT